MKKKSEVLRTPPAAPKDALEYFQAQLVFETDCWDVHASLQTDNPGFVLLDVRSKELYDRGHVDGAVHLANWEISGRRLADYPPDTLFVVYCAGPHCNGATKAAVRLSKLERPVKLMAGGVEGWKDEGFSLVST